MRHLFTSLYWFAFLLALLLLAALLWSIATPQGSRWTITTLLQASGKNLAVSRLTGTLISQPGIGKIAYEDDRIKVNGQGIRLDYRPGALRHKALLIRELDVQQLTITLKEPAKPGKQQETTIPALSLPFRLQVKQIHIQELTINRPEKPPLEFHDIQLQGSMEHTLMTLEKLAFSSPPFQLDSSGAFDFSPPQNIQLKASISNQRSIARISIEGPPKGYRLHGNITVRERPPFVPMQATVDATGDLKQLSVESLNADLLGGNIVANGHIGWREGLRISASFSGSNINPKGIDSRYPGNISFGGQATLDGQQLSTQLAVSGKLREFRFQTETDSDINIEKQSANIHNGRLLLGPNLLRFAGNIDRAAARKLNFSIDAPRLSTFHPEVTGQLWGKGEIQGKWRSPEVQLKLKGKTLSFREQSIRTISLDLKPEKPAGTVRLDLEAESLKHKALTVGKLRFTGVINQQQQQGNLSLTVPAAKARAQFSFSGQYDKPQHRWRGSLEKFTVTAFGLPEYRQQASSAIHIAREGFSASKLCLAARKETLCARADLNRGQASSARLTIDKFAIKHFAQWFPPARLFKETADAEINFQGDDQRYSMTTDVKLGGKPLIEGEVTMDPATQTLLGRINAQFDKLEWVSLLSDDLLNPKGKLTAHLEISGTLTQPEIIGEASLENGAVQLPLAGITLHDIGINAISRKGRNARIEGSLLSGRGKLKIDGDIDWSSLQDTHVRLKFSGEDFEAANLPQAKVLISPDLQLISYQKQTTLSGYLRIPEADIRFTEIPEGAVRPSPDTYFIDEPEKEKSSRLNIYSQINIELGKKVHLSGFGLDTGLTGNLRTTEIPEKPTLGDGAFKVVDGFYQALGQKLMIDRGEIYFNGPLNSPGINLRVSRTDNGVTSGLTITGPIQQPESRIFSDPPMDETNALSYLLTGKPLGATGGGDSNMLLNAVARLGLKGSAGLIDDLRNRTGLDTLAIKPGEDLEQSEVVIGKYLSPRLYLEYTSHLFEDASILSMQYKLNRHLQLKAESGDNTQSIDLIYQIEN